MAVPLRQTLRDLRLQISVLNEMLGNGELANSQAQSTAIKAVVDAVDVAVQAAASSAALTVIS